MTYKDANGRERLKSAVSLKATVGVATGPLWVCVFASGCPVGKAYCVDYIHNGAQDFCPHFWEVETIDYLPMAKCDHPQAESDLEG